MTEQRQDVQPESVPHDKDLEVWSDLYQRARYKLLQDERAVNWWRIALLLVLLLLAGVVALTARPGPERSAWLLRLGVTFLACEIMVGCWLFTLDTTLRFHENKGGPITDPWAKLHRRTTAAVQMLYYLGSLVGLALLVLGLW